MTLANQLTILRMLLVPAIAILVVYGFFGWALIVFFVAGVTDALDGLAARLRNEQTELGTLLDPLADKLLVTVALIVLSLPSTELTVRIPAWITILSISRDFGILLTVLLFSLTLPRRRSYPPSPLGKVTTAVHLGMILWVLICNFRGESHPVTNILFGLTVVLVVASALQYLFVGQRILVEEERNKAETPRDG